MTETPAEMFREAWMSVQGDDAESRLVRQSLRALADGDPELEVEYVRLTSPSQAVLSLRLSGDGVVGHETSARMLGDLVRRLSRTVKEVAKSELHVRRYSETLLVTAPAAGSVQLQFRAPDAKRTQATMVAETETIESVALREIVSLMVQAEESADQLPASVNRLHGRARQQVGALAATVAQAEWDVDGRLTSPSRGSVAFALTRRSAKLLADAASVRQYEVGSVAVSGGVDGWTWSSATMRFIPEVGQAFSANVAPDLQDEVARLNGDRGRVVDAVFDVVTTYPVGDADSARRSYSLTSIVETPRHMTFDDLLE